MSDVDVSDQCTHPEGAAFKRDGYRHLPVVVLAWFGRSLGRSTPRSIALALLLESR